MIAVDIAESSETVRDFVQKRGLTFTNLLDETTAVARAYAIRSIPASYFIDRQGVIRAVHIGPLTEEQIDEYVANLR